MTAAAVRSAQRWDASEITPFADAGTRRPTLIYRRLGFDVVAEFAEFAVSRGDPTPAPGSDRG